MSELFRLLAMYYACDNTAMMRTLSAAEVADCMAYYTEIKAHFAGSDAPLEGYQRFKIWERDNNELVAQLRDGRFL